VCIHTPEHTGDGYTSATLWNVAVDRIGLLTAGLVEPGTQFSVEFFHLLVRDRVAKVIEIDPNEEGWLVGCEVDPPFSAPELLALEL
jgi:hypothetical protein